MLDMLREGLYFPSTVTGNDANFFCFCEKKCLKMLSLNKRSHAVMGHNMEASKCVKVVHPIEATIEIISYIMDAVMKY